MTLIILLLSIVLLFSVLKIAVRLAWGIFKIVCGIILFTACPVLFFVVLFAGLSQWIWLLVLMAVFSGFLFRTAA